VQGAVANPVANAEAVQVSSTHITVEKTVFTNEMAIRKRSICRYKLYIKGELLQPYETTVIYWVLKSSTQLILGFEKATF
jgi:hypothetical protein